MAGVETVHSLYFSMNTAPPAIVSATRTRQSSLLSEFILQHPMPFLPRNLDPIEEVEEGDATESPRRSITSRTSVFYEPHRGYGPTSKRRRRVWFCCQDGFGPYEVHYVSECLECHHTFCDCCRQEATK